MTSQALPADTAEATRLLAEIDREEQFLTGRFAPLLTVNGDLDRTLVSYQANKSEATHRWCKYKEGFSAALVRYALDRVGLRRGRLLDPFAGSGTALFTAAEQGLDAVGVELLPCSAEIIAVRNLLRGADRGTTAEALRRFGTERPWHRPGQLVPFPHLAITRGAFPADNEASLGRYLWECRQIDDPLVARACRFAALCVLESISYTRKDGQYLRWDARSGRKGARFDKGAVLGFTAAVTAKLEQMAGDLGATAPITGRIDLHAGSCLDVLPTLPTGSFDGLMTSPPYCNRYDYTRTYALELALMGLGEDGVRDLRQALLSCTVENRAKADLGRRSGEAVSAAARTAFASQALLGKILHYLERCRHSGTLNNPGIPRMVRGYFEELTLTLFECARLLKSGAPLVLVNDNVRYHGVHVPVDLILSDLAARAGFTTEVIWVLPRGKGNSSQQMGTHGRRELRKCVYVWRRA